MNVGIICKTVLMYRQGEIVLIPYPFTDLSGSKKRPVVIISKTSINSPDLIVCKITSRLRGDRFSFRLEDEYLTSPLPFPSEVRTNQLMTIHQNLVVRCLTSIKRDALSVLLEKIKDNISLE